MLNKLQSIIKNLSNIIKYLNNYFTTYFHHISTKIMENQSSESIQQQDLINNQSNQKSKTLILSLRAESFQQMINDSRPNGKTRVLNSKALNNYIANELGSLECQTIKITHKNSKINTVFDRNDSKYFTAHGFCSQSTHCPVVYSFVVKNESEEDGFIKINTEIKGNYQNQIHLVTFEFSIIKLYVINRTT